MSSAKASSALMSIKLRESPPKAGAGSLRAPHSKLTSCCVSCRETGWGQDMSCGQGVWPGRHQHLRWSLSSAHECVALTSPAPALSLPTSPGPGVFLGVGTQPAQGKVQSSRDGGHVHRNLSCLVQHRLSASPASSGRPCQEKGRKAEREGKKEGDRRAGMQLRGERGCV